MRESDWSSDVCSSDLVRSAFQGLAEDKMIETRTERGQITDLAKRLPSTTHTMHKEAFIPSIFWSSTIEDTVRSASRDKIIPTSQNLHPTPRASNHVITLYNVSFREKYSCLSNANAEISAIEEGGKTWAQCAWAKQRGRSEDRSTVSPPRFGSSAVCETQSLSIQ